MRDLGNLGNIFDNYIRDKREPAVVEVLNKSQSVEFDDKFVSFTISIDSGDGCPSQYNHKICEHFISLKMYNELNPFEPSYMKYIVTDVSQADIPDKEEIENDISTPNLFCFVSEEYRYTPRLLGKNWTMVILNGNYDPEVCTERTDMKTNKDDYINLLDNAPQLDGINVETSSDNDSGDYTGTQGDTIVMNIEEEQYVDMRNQYTDEHGCLWIAIVSYDDDDIVKYVQKFAVFFSMNHGCATYRSNVKKGVFTSDISLQQSGRKPQMHILYGDIADEILTDAGTVSKVKGENEVDEQASPYSSSGLATIEHLRELASYVMNDFTKQKLADSPEDDDLLKLVDKLDDHTEPLGIEI